MSAKSHEHRTRQVEQPRRLADETILFCGDRHPSGAAVAADASVHPDVEVCHSRLTDDSGVSKISLHGLGQSSDVAIRDDFSRRQIHKPLIHVAFECCAQTVWTGRCEAERNSDENESIDEHAERGAAVACLPAHSRPA